MMTKDTQGVVDELYSAFLGGDPEGMLGTFRDDIRFRFLGQVDGQGIDAARLFFAHAGGLLTNVEFIIERVIIDGDRAAVIWTETARTSAGADWENHGVDVIEVKDGRVVSLHENNDVRLVHEHLGRYEA